MLVLTLALRDCREEWPSALCMVLAITAVLVPILLLLSIRSGVIGQMQGELSENPQARELVTVGEPPVTAKLVDHFRRSSDVAFVAPRTRFLSASAVMRTEDLSKGVELDMIPSGSGDPIIRTPWRKSTVALSEAAARQLSVNAGDKVLLIINRRTREGEQQQVRLPLQVLEVVEYRWSGNSLNQAYLPASIVEAAERWREDPAIADLKAALVANQSPDEKRRYSGLRIYANSVDAVIRLRAELVRFGIDTESRAADIRLVRRLERSMNIFVGSLASLMGLGLIVALGAIQWGWVERKRFDYSYLRLLGMRKAELAILPVMQAMVMVVPAFLFAMLITVAAQAVINRMFLGQLGNFENVSRVEVADTALLVILTFAVAGCGAFFASRNASRISSIAALRGN